MADLKPEHELPPPEEHLDLPPPHHGPGWAWLFSLVVSSVVTFGLTLILIGVGLDLIAVSFIAPVVFVFGTLIVRPIADRER